MTAAGQAYERGFTAGVRGRYRSDNPYRPGTQDRDDWDDGWADGRADEADREGEVWSNA